MYAVRLVLSVTQVGRSAATFAVRSMSEKETVLTIWIFDDAG